MRARQIVKIQILSCAALLNNDAVFIILKIVSIVCIDSLARRIISLVEFGICIRIIVENKFPGGVDCSRRILLITCRFTEHHNIPDHQILHNAVGIFLSALYRNDNFVCNEFVEFGNGSAARTHLSFRCVVGIYPSMLFHIETEIGNGRVSVENDRPVLFHFRFNFNTLHRIEAIEIVESVIHHYGTHCLRCIPFQRNRRFLSVRFKFFYKIQIVALKKIIIQIFGTASVLYIRRRNRCGFRNVAITRQHFGQRLQRIGWSVRIQDILLAVIDKEHAIDAKTSSLYRTERGAFVKRQRFTIFIGMIKIQKISVHVDHTSMSRSGNIIVVIFFVRSSFIANDSAALIRVDLDKLTERFIGNRLTYRIFGETVSVGIVREVVFPVMLHHERSLVHVISRNFRRHRLTARRVISGLRQVCQGGIIGAEPILHFQPPNAVLTTANSYKIQIKLPIVVKKRSRVDSTAVSRLPILVVGELRQIKKNVVHADGTTVLRGTCPLHERSSRAIGNRKPDILFSGCVKGKIIRRRIIHIVFTVVIDHFRCPIQPRSPSSGLRLKRQTHRLPIHEVFASPCKETVSADAVARSISVEITAFLSFVDIQHRNIRRIEEHIILIEKAMVIILFAIQLIVICQ